MTREKYIEIVTNIVNWYKQVDDIYDVSDKSISLWENETLNKVVDSLIYMLEETTNDKEDESGYSALSYFLFELDCGKNWKEGCFVDNDKDIKLDSIEHLADYIFKKDVDKETP